MLHSFQLIHGWQLAEAHLDVDEILPHFLVVSQEVGQFGYLQESVVTRVVHVKDGR